MRQVRAGLGWAAGLPWMGTLAAVVLTIPAEAAGLNQWQFDPNTHQLVITLPKDVTPRYYLIAEPARIVLDLPNTEVGNVPVEQSYAGAVSQIRIAQFQPGLARVVMVLSPNAVLAPGQVELQRLDGADGNTQRWALRPLLVTDASNATTAQVPAVPPTENAQAEIEQSAAEQPVAEQPVAEQPAAEVALPPVAEQPAVEPTTENAQAENAQAENAQTMAAQPAAEASASEESVAESTSVEVPALEDSQAAETPSTEISSTETSAEIATEDAQAASDAETETDAQAVAEPAQAANPQQANSQENSQEVSSQENSQEADSAVNSSTNPATLPPLEPGAVEIPVEQPSTVAATPNRSEEATNLETVAESDSTTEAEANPANNTGVNNSDSNSNANNSVVAASPATPNLFPPASTATAISDPLPVDFSLPPGTAAALSLPSTGRSAISATTRTTNSASSPPLGDTLSFPMPTANGVSVPSIGTVAANQPVEPPQIPTPAPASTNAQPTATMPTPTMPTPTAAIPFGQPLQSGQATPRNNAANTSQHSTRQPVPFGQPIPQNVAVNETGNAQANGQSGRAATQSRTQPNIQPTSQPAPQPTAQSNPQPSAPVKPKIQVIQFGQPLPTSQSMHQETLGNAVADGVLLPSGTVLKLRYPGQTALELAEQPSQQEVLLLDQAVHDSSGNVLLPVGSPVLGRFETTESGSLFVAQALQMQGGQQIPLSAQSEQLSGERQVSENGMLRNSAIGAIAGTVLGAVTGVGLIPAVIAGAATSAATTYVTSPDSAAVVQPNQVVEVRLTQDLKK